MKHDEKYGSVNKGRTVEQMNNYRKDFPNKTHQGKSTPRSKALKTGNGYTGHYQETATGQIRHQSPSQVSKKKLEA
jgi:hypothetical protein